MLQESFARAPLDGDGLTGVLWTEAIHLAEDMMMQVTIEIPDELAQRLQTKWQDTLAHYLWERLVMEAYRDELLSTREVQDLLGLEERFAVYDLCTKYHIVLYTLEDLEHDRATARQLGL